MLNNKSDLNSIVQTIGISKDQILREMNEMIFLNSLSKDDLSRSIIFYGGTALRLAYNSPRFSEDIDLLEAKTISFPSFKNFISEFVTEHPNWNLKDLKDKRSTMFALFVVDEPELKHALPIKIELRKNVDNVSCEKELKMISSEVSIFQPLLFVPTLNQLLILKTEAIMERKKARDIFDLWYLSQVTRAKFELPTVLPNWNEREFKNELKVFLPKKYYPIIDELYAQISR